MTKKELMMLKKKVKVEIQSYRGTGRKTPWTLVKLVFCHNFFYILFQNSLLCNGSHRYQRLKCMYEAIGSGGYCVGGLFLCSKELALIVS